MYGVIDRRALRREARRLLGLLDLDLPVDAPMRTLSVAGMQTVEIARAIGADAAAVIMDEPTAAISEREVQALFRSMRTLKARIGRTSCVFRRVRDTAKSDKGASVKFWAARKGAGQARKGFSDARR